MPFRHRNGILNLCFNSPDCSGMTGNISYADRAEYELFDYFYRN